MCVFVSLMRVCDYEYVHAHEQKFLVHEEQSPIRLGHPWRIDPIRDVFIFLSHMGKSTGWSVGPISVVSKAGADFQCLRPTSE